MEKYNNSVIQPEIVLNYMDVLTFINNPNDKFDIIDYFKTKDFVEYPVKVVNLIDCSYEEFLKPENNVGEELKIINNFVSRKNELKIINEEDSKLDESIIPPVYFKNSFNKNEVFSKQTPSILLQTKLENYLDFVYHKLNNKLLSKREILIKTTINLQDLFKQNYELIQNVKKIRENIKNSQINLVETPQKLTNLLKKKKETNLLIDKILKIKEVDSKIKELNEKIKSNPLSLNKEVEEIRIFIKNNINDLNISKIFENKLNEILEKENIEIINCCFDILINKKENEELHKLIQTIYNKNCLEILVKKIKIYFLKKNNVLSIYFNNNLNNLKFENFRNELNNILKDYTQKIKKIHNIFHLIAKILLFENFGAAIKEEIIKDQFNTLLLFFDKFQNDFLTFTSKELMENFEILRKYLVICKIIINCENNELENLLEVIFNQYFNEFHDKQLKKLSNIIKYDDWKKQEEITLEFIKSLKVICDCSNENNFLIIDQKKFLCSSSLFVFYMIIEQYISFITNKIDFIYVEKFVEKLYSFIYFFLKRTEHLILQTNAINEGLLKTISTKNLLLSYDCIYSIESVLDHLTYKLEIWIEVGINFNEIKHTIQEHCKKYREDVYKKIKQIMQDKTENNIQKYLILNWTELKENNSEEILNIIKDLKTFFIILEEYSHREEYKNLKNEIINFVIKKITECYKIFNDKGFGMKERNKIWNDAILFENNLKLDLLNSLKENYLNIFK